MKQKAKMFNWGALAAIVFALIALTLCSCTRHGVVVGKCIEPETVRLVRVPAYVGGDWVYTYKAYADNKDFVVFLKRPDGVIKRQIVDSCTWGVVSVGDTL